MRATTRLRHLIAQGGLHLAPGAFDGLSARLIEDAGFPLVYASGGALSRSQGFPDIGLLSLDEVCARLEPMVEVTRVPILADADTGFGNAVNARRTLRRYERIGVAGLHVEDQTFPKRCGHLDDKTLISTADMVHKLRVMADARTDPDFLLVARTDAIATEGLDAALRRAEAYRAAGADMIFVEAPESLAQIQTIAREVEGPKLINMFHGGKTPLVDRSILAGLGYNLAIIPSDVQRAAIRAIQQVLAIIARDGDSGALADAMAGFAEREALVRTRHYLDL